MKIRGNLLGVILVQMKQLILSSGTFLYKEIINVPGISIHKKCTKIPLTMEDWQKLGLCMELEKKKYVCLYQDKKNKNSGKVKREK